MNVLREHHGTGVTDQAVFGDDERSLAMGFGADRVSGEGQKTWEAAVKNCFLAERGHVFEVSRFTDMQTFVCLSEIE